MTTTPASRSDHEPADARLRLAQDLDLATARLAAHFPEFEPALIHRIVEDSFARLVDGELDQEHLVTLAEHRAGLRLDEKRQRHM